jgi:hypothetical protein
VAPIGDVVQLSPPPTAPDAAGIEEYTARKLRSKPLSSPARVRDGFARAAAYQGTCTIMQLLKHFTPYFVDDAPAVTEFTATVNWCENSNIFWVAGWIASEEMRAYSIIHPYSGEIPIRSWCFRRAARKMRFFKAAYAKLFAKLKEGSARVSCREPSQLMFDSLASTPAVSKLLGRIRPAFTDIELGLGFEIKMNQIQVFFGSWDSMCKSGECVHWLLMPYGLRPGE